MPEPDLLSAPSPVDGRKQAVVLLTDADLWFAWAMDPESVATLGELDEGVVAESIGPRSWSLPRGSIRTLRTTGSGTRIAVRSSEGRREIVLGETAGDCLRWLAERLALEPVREVEASWWERVRTPVWWLLLVAFGGAYLLLVAQPGASGFGHALLQGIGLPTLSAVIGLALLAAAAWTIHRFRQPQSILVAVRADGSADRPAGIAPERVCEATAVLLRIDPDKLSLETRFDEDLGLPPGEVLELVAELEEELGREALPGQVTSIAELVAAFR